jgi:RNA polymerase sporulation-specific sigma factor
MVSYNTKKPQNSSTFSTYAYTCIKNKIVDAVRAGDSGKNQALNNFLHILEDNYPSDINPEEQLIDNEENNEFLKELKILLSDFEYKVLSMYIDGHTMGEISTALDTSKKSVDNAINRAKNKIQQKINKQS